MEILEIQKQNLFVTPKSMEQVVEFCRSLPEGERAGALTASAMTWNYLAQLIADNNLANEVSK
jgi:hypothetical protein